MSAGVNMPTAILIGFEYKFNTLIGAIIDIYHAYKWCESYKCEVYVFTDISRIVDNKHLQLAIDRNIADPDLLSFYDRIKIETIVTSGTDLLNGIKNVLQNYIADDKVVIYYSGHGVKDSMVMPDKTLLPFIDFRDAILNSVNDFTELFWILDCCNPNGLHLPYKLVNNKFILSKSKIECVTQPILLITSSDASEKSIATKVGSVFSRHLFKILSHMNEDDKLIIKKRKVIIPIHRNRNLRRLICNLSSAIRKMHTGYSQTVSIYSSYVIDPILWMWIGSQKKHDIVSDMTLSTLIIRNCENSQNPYDLVYPNI